MKALLLLLACLILVLTIQPARAAQALVVLPTQSSLTTAFVSELQAALGTPVEVITTATATLPPEARYQYIITMGQDALDWRLRQRAQSRTLATYITSEYWHPRSQTAPPWLSALYADPEPARQLQLSRLLAPRLDRAGILLSRDSRWQRARWQAAADQQGITLTIAEVDGPDDLSRQLLGLLGRSDILLGTDDSSIYNADNLKTILLTSYSRNKVLIGPSAPFIDAGSLSTTYSSPQDMARSVAYLLEQGLPPQTTSYPRYFSVLSNAQVARSLGIPLPDDATLARRLAELEQEP
ncbi:ABC transporter substrate-binding protein [Pseudomonas sp.]|uniref:ABC transporter substrate-binding protein n=1 Tax=Pseudomonas sp. TaxID=306 RepID=UPI000C982D9A|nr:ABC transporter substrate-binding protein [Pseudomonadales bacterium]